MNHTIRVDCTDTNNTLDKILNFLNFHPHLIIFFTYIFLTIKLLIILMVKKYQEFQSTRNFFLFASLSLFLKFNVSKNIYKRNEFL